MAGQECDRGFVQTSSCVYVDGIGYVLGRFRITD
jgi:hypothetical protein